MVSSQSGIYQLYGSHFELDDTSFRITIELALSLPGMAFITGTIQLYVTTTTVGGFSLLTNTIYSQNGDSFTGSLSIGKFSIYYRYGISIQNENSRPKILKVERLRGVN